MIFFIFILIQQISSCPYLCDSCDETSQQCSVCNSQRQLVQLLVDVSSQQTCQCKDNYIDVGGNQCLQCANNCVKCKQSNPSYCTDCGNVTQTHRILDENNQCVCDTGYQNVWFTYECQSLQFDYQILQFQYILQQKQYVQRLQQKYNYTQDTINGINYMINRGVINDSIHPYQYLHSIQQNQILTLNSPYPQGQYYAQQFDNLYTLGIKLSLEQQIYWVANVKYKPNQYQFFQTKRILYDQWSVGIYQFKLQDFDNQIFLQIAISENKNVGTQNRLLSEQTGNMTLFYYLGYNLDRFLYDPELNEIVNDILFIMIVKNDYIDQYSFDGQQIVIDSCIQNYEINGQECDCPTQNGYYFYENVCYTKCPTECVTCTNEVCIIDDNTKHCRDGYYQDNQIDEFECYPCNEECITCTSLDQCVKCKSQHINIDGKCITCQEYSNNISNCKSFDEQQCLCIDCNIGYQLNIDNSCFSCPETCIQCQFKDQCIICKDGYFLENFECKQCQNHCLQCSQYDLCTSIEYGYYFDDGLVNQCQNICNNYKEDCLCVDCPQYYYLSNETQMCNNCISPCQQCSDVDICIDCISEEYYFNEGKCNNCESPCKLCKSKNTCITCIDDEFYFDNVQEYCYKCTSPCQTCEYIAQQQNCKTCIQKHYLFLFQCLECPSYCIDDCYFDEINNFVQCKGCISGYYQSQQTIPFQCLQCPNNCLTCQSQDICITCVAGSVLINNKCVKCSSLYSEYCTECDENTCITCLKEYEVKDKICKQIVVIVIPICKEIQEFYNAVTNTCDKCILNCNKCQNSQFCTICIDEYFQDQGTCTSCLSPCQNCQSLNYCMTLQNQNYYIDTSKTDISIVNYDKCKSPCKTCLSLTDCLDCVDGYYKDSLKCIKCDQNCLTCSTSNVCTSCPPGYKLQGSICLKCLDEKCQECFDQCIQCNHLEIQFYKCFICLPGYVLIDNQCVKCDDTCKTCQDLTTSCTSCLKGYYLTKEMTCEKCDDGCNDCQVQTKSCISCQTGLQLVTEDKIFYYCVECPISCRQCMSATKCNICEDKTFLNEHQQCEKCVSPCQTCTSKDQCLTCVEGYYLQDGKCIKCTGACLSCTSATDCTSCSKFYFLNNNVCESCPNGCSTCIDQTHCTACNIGYYLNDVCFQCSEHCTKCTNEKCDGCESGYELSLDGKSCSLKQTQCKIENCSQCNEDKLKCISCNANYQLDQQGLKCVIQQTQNDVQQTPQQGDSGGSSLVFVAAAAGGSILILAFLIWKFNIHKICKLRIKIRRFNNEKEEYPQLPITNSL